MWKIGKSIFVVSYRTSNPNTRSSYRQLAGSVIPEFDITRLEVIEHKKVKGKYHKEGLSDKDMKDGYRLTDDFGNEWGIHWPHANLSDIGRSDHVAVKLTGLSSNDHSENGVEICYHLNEFCVSSHSDKTVGVITNHKQRAIIQKFCKEFPGWDLTHTSEASVPFNSSGCGRFITKASFSVIKTELFA